MVSHMEISDRRGANKLIEGNFKMMRKNHFSSILLTLVIIG